MSSGIGKGYLLAVFALSLIVSSNAWAAMKPSLYGMVVLQTPSGLLPLEGAKIELLSPGAKKAKYKTYSNSRGKFVFYRIPPGTYDLRILFGKRVLRQVTADGLKARTSLLVPVGTTEVPRILVRSR